MNIFEQLRSGLLSQVKNAEFESELSRRMPEASERVLAQQLKELMEYGVIEKNVIDPVCKHTEYSRSRS